MKSKIPVNFTLVHLLINLMLAVLIGWQIFFGQFFQIKTIYIKGDRELLNNTDFFKTNENLISFSKSNYLNNINKNYPFIKSVIITKKYPSSLIVEIIKRNPIFYTIFENKTLFIDEDGIVLPILKIWENEAKIKLNCEIKSDQAKITVSDSNLIKQFATAFYLIKNTDWKITEFVCLNKNEYKMIVENIEIIFLSDIERDNLLSSLQVLFKQFRIEGKQPVRIDLRFSKPVIQYELEKILNSASPSGN